MLASIFINAIRFEKVLNTYKNLTSFFKSFICNPRMFKQLLSITLLYIQISPPPCFLWFFLQLFFIITNFIDYIFLFIPYTEKKKKENSEQWKIKQTKIHTSIYSHAHHEYGMHESMYPWNKTLKENAN